MEKHNEHANGKSPIDALFARKLGDASLRPSAEGFERLQARIGQRQTEPRLAIWRNPAMQPYMAVAACLAVVCLFGWLYVSDSKNGGSVNTQLADNRSINQPSTGHKEQKAVKPDATVTQSRQLNKAGEGRFEAIEQNDRQLATVDKSVRAVDKSLVPAGQIRKPVNLKPATPTDTRNDVMVAQGQPDEPKAVKEPTSKSLVEEAPATPERVATTQPAPAPVSERVLVVTIAEPDQLVAARQVARTAVNNSAADDTDKAQKETKQGGFWEQVRRVKQGEVFARRNASDEERGLLSRAYSGLKHSIEKDKDLK